jgi:ribosome-associated protein
VTDYFIIATGTSPRQMRSVAEDIEELAEKHGLKVLTRNGYEGESWILIDLVDVIVHIFNAPSREYYDLDNLWGDARKIDWRGKSGQAKTG